MNKLQRPYLRVDDFDIRQNPRRPKRPTWLKMFVGDLDVPEYLSLTLAVRGFLADFQRLAADLKNEVPHDVQYIARRLSIPPAVAGKALNTCMTHGLITQFAITTSTRQNNQLRAPSDSGAANASSS